MNRVGRHTLGAPASLLAGTACADGLSPNSLGGEDPIALGESYETAFGLHEVNRLTFPTGVELTRPAIAAS